MTIQFNTGIESLDRLQFKVIPSRKTKVDAVAMIDRRLYAVAGDTVYTDGFFIPLGSRAIHRATLDMTAYWRLYMAAIQLKLVNERDAAQVQKTQAARVKAHARRRAAVQFSVAAVEAGIKLTTKQQRHVDMAKAASAQLDGSAK